MRVLLDQPINSTNLKLPTSEYVNFREFNISHALMTGIAFRVFCRGLIFCADIVNGRITEVPTNTWLNLSWFNIEGGE